MPYAIYSEACNATEVLTQDEWEFQYEEEYPQFKFSSIALRFELQLLEFVKSLRVGDFDNYIKTLEFLTPWMFSLDHVHYARWLPVHIRDMRNFKERHPELYQEFKNKKFVVQKSNRKFSMIAMDQNHEQQNAIVKGVGGVVGLTENTTALRRWCVCGPEIARVLNKFESCRQSKVYCIDNEHHDATLSTQVTFVKHVKSLVATIEDNGNPFLEDSKDIYCLDTKEVKNEKVVHTVYNIEEIGKKQFNEYIEDRLNTSMEPVTKTIKKNNNLAVSVQT